jgi:hypothetical protein
MDLVNLTDKLTAGCDIKIHENTDWPQKLELRPNDMQFPTDTCFPSNFGTRHGSHISVRLRGADDVRGDRFTAPAIFLEFTITDQDLFGQQLRSDCGLLHHVHYASLNGRGIDSAYKNMQHLITAPLDLNDTFQDALQGHRSSWMLDNERLSTHTRSLRQPFFLSLLSRIKIRLIR